MLHSALYDHETFQSTPPGWEATAAARRRDTTLLFQSTPPGWEATVQHQDVEFSALFQSTPPGWEATVY